MSWRDNLMPGSWRGLPFLCRDTGNNGGRRLGEFEFPDSDSVYVQDLGRGIKTYTLEIYVAGDDYMAMRDQIEAALDGDGPGTLVHPYRGPLQVFCKHPFRLKEMALKGRAAFFEVDFVEAGSPEPPIAAPDTSAQATAAAATVNPLLATAYVSGP